MSSVIFQPLLHDPLGWKSTKSTYTDHYKWRKYRSSSKTKKSSTPIIPLPVTTSDEKTIQPIVLANNKTEQTRAKTASCRSSSAKPPTELKQRPASASEAVITSLTNSSPSTNTPAVEEKASAINEKKPVDPNNDNSRHWLTYPNPKTPQYILEIKQRLGQWKGSFPTTSATSTVENSSPEVVVSPPVSRPTSASSQKRQPTTEDQHNFLNFERRETPDSVRAVRYRLDKHRYNPSLDNYPARPSEVTKSVQETSDVPTMVRADAWAPEEEQQKANPFEQDSQTSIVVQMIDCDGLPHEYAEALRTANAAQEEYQRTVETTNERRCGSSPVYRLPTENQMGSLVAYQQQQQKSSAMSKNFNSWVRNATEKEKASAMKILQEVLNQPVLGYDVPINKKNLSKQAPAPPPIRASSATRKLGRTRNQHQFPCEVCEKLLIKRHVWDLSRPETGVCPHQSGRVSVRT